jgi:signal transduction histidine kinase
LILVLCLIAGIFTAGYWALRASHLSEAERLLDNLRQERGEFVDKIIELTGLPLKNFAYDYSYWDDLVAFVDKPDPQWAKLNLEASLATFKANGVWVLKPGGEQVYGAVAGLPAEFARLNFSGPEMVAAVRERRFAHFFVDSSAGLLECRVAPIQPSIDRDRVSPPMGWFIVARLWNAEHLEGLRRVLGGELVLERKGGPAEPVGALTVSVDRMLTDWRGLAVSKLRSTFSPKPLELLLSENENEKLLFTLPGLVMIVFTAFALSRWVLRPLKLFEESFATNSAAPVQPLRNSPDAFGRLARALETSIEQRHALEHEIEERRRIEEALRASEESVRRAGELRTRLARDLHDGVIQSIYAAGLGLEGVRNSLDTRAEAERKIDASQTSLNQTIREVRAFIQGLEPEDAPRPEFTQALEALVATLRPLHTARIELELTAPGLQLSAREEVHSLQIVRECVSNAHRHGNANHILIRLQTTPTGGELVIADDGRGFDLANGRASGGSGLANLHARAAEIGATLEIVTAPGKGTRVTMRFSSR